LIVPRLDPSIKAKFSSSLSLSRRFLPWANISNVDRMLNYMTIKHYFRRECESSRILYWIQEIVLLTFNTCYAPILIRFLFPICSIHCMYFLTFHLYSFFLCCAFPFCSLCPYCFTLLIYPFVLLSIVFLSYSYCNVPFSCFTIVSIIDCKLFVLA
jgi:hypothetical protein